MSDNLILTNAQKKQILQGFKELDMHKELQILFEKMYPNDTSVYITHGRDEMGRDLIISETKPIGMENTAVVVKMDKLSGSASDRPVQEVIMQVNQCFQVPKSVKDQMLPLVTNKVFVCIFGEVSNKAQDNLDASLQMHKGRIEYLDLEKLSKLFTDYYSNVFIGAVEIEILHNKYNELEEQVLEKNKLLTTSYIEPNLRMYKKSRTHLMAISKSSDQNKVTKVIGDNLFGEKETLQSIACKALSSPHKILIEGEAGSGKTILVLKLTMQIIKETIHHINVKDKKDLTTIEVPIVLKATKLKNVSDIKKLIDNFYIKSSSPLKKNLLIIDAIDEVNNEDKENIISITEKYANDNKISLIFTSRKSTEVKKRLRNYENYELLPFETSQAIDFIKRMAGKNKVLSDVLIKGLSELKHQIPLSPMSLSLLIEIAQTQKEIPASISELYKRYVDMALSQYSDGEKINVLFEPSIKRDFLECLSYEVYYKNDQVIISREKFDNYLDTYIHKFPAISDKNDFVHDLERTSILKVDENKVDFLHKSFLDYFIASYFKNRQTDLLELDEFKNIYSLYHSSLWEDVTYFYFGQKTRINKTEIDKILSSTPEEHSDLLKDLGQFLIGKLMQYAWHSNFDDKKYAIQLGISNVLSLRSNLVKFTEDELGMQLPKILGDIQMLHFIDEAFSSKFLVEEVKSVIDDMQNNRIEMTKDLFYFTTLYVLENASLIGQDFLNKYLDTFLENSGSMPPNISLPLTNIVAIFIKNNKIEATPEMGQNLKKATIKLKKRHEELNLDYLSFKNKINQLRLKRLTAY